jgi:hypothetical protein
VELPPSDGFEVDAIFVTATVEVVESTLVVDAEVVLAASGSAAAGTGADAAVVVVASEGAGATVVVTLMVVAPGRVVVGAVAAGRGVAGAAVAGAVATGAAAVTGAVGGAAVVGAAVAGVEPTFWLIVRDPPSVVNVTDHVPSLSWIEPDVRPAELVEGRFADFDPPGPAALITTP